MCVCVCVCVCVYIYIYTYIYIYIYTTRNITLKYLLYTDQEIARVFTPGFQI